MADIKQAAKWMKEGKKVKRASWERGYCHAPFAKVVDDDGKHTDFPFSVSDVCWCQPFDGPIHPNCPMHGEETSELCDGTARR